ncbi:ribosomal subunit 39S-domain-containing protein [Lineolata rhizophorae]|uniref:Large ribosomal subunit protein mL50 n=1 Tax=Lineolata rhizophorae TaxID=578093 RepID=A0A6A6P2S6_9PEZI|nr:ribosomal subunit 39S-domain-containing protein [Lineolata rhizophorae]
MRRIPRAACVRPAHHLSLRPASRSHAVPFSSTGRCRKDDTDREQPAEADRKEWPLSERIRSRIWGVPLGQAPGREDPYDPNSPMRRQGAAEESGEKRKWLWRTGKKEGEEEEVTELERAEDVSETPEYQEAKTWDGLAWVGGEAFVEAMKPSPKYRKYGPATQLQETDDIHEALHRAVVEVLILREEGEDLVKACHAPITPELNWASSVAVQPSEDGESVTLEYHEPMARTYILELMKSNNESQSAADAEGKEGGVEDQEVGAEDQRAAAEEEQLAAENEQPTADEEHVTVEEEQVASEEEQQVTTTPGKASNAFEGYRHSNWMAVPLSDMELKFAVIKRAMQLTGIHVSDPAINDINTVGNLATAMITPPPPKKLAQHLAQSEELAELPNVRVFGRRVTPIDKEKRIGRWKIIEEELRRLDLPVTGHR